MSFLFTHLIFIWITGKGYEFYKKTTLTPLTWVLLFLGAILPDIEFPIDWLFGTAFHRTFTHSFLMILVSFIGITLVSGTFIKNYKRAALFGILFSIGIFSHLLLDFSGSEGVPLLWPSTAYYSATDGIKDITERHLQLFQDPPEKLLYKTKLILIDSTLGILWISYLFWKRKITTF